MITDAQESNLAQAAGRGPKFKQDKKHPFLIHVKDGRLYPNTQKLRESKVAPDYRIFTGNPKASAEERKLWLETQGAAPGLTPVIESEPFDIGKATAEELIGFALSEYGTTIKSDQRMTTEKQLVDLRSQVRKLAEQAGAMRTKATDDLS